MRLLLRLPGFLALTSILTISSFSQRHREPFTPAEIDQIRDTSWQPEQRLVLYVKFARARLVTMEELRGNPKTKDRAGDTHDKLDDFLLIYDELNDNIDTYVERRNDIRRPLKAIIDADTEFQSKLLALRDAAGVTPQESGRYEFVLHNALETVDASVDDHRKLLDEQQETAKHKKFAKATSGKLE